MKHNDFLNIIPSQETGNEIEAEAQAGFPGAAEAILFYERAKSRLLDVNNWERIAGALSASFRIVDAGGKEGPEQVQKGCYLRIDVPGPGSKAGDGYDWVFVEELSEKEEEDRQGIGFRVRPCENPLGNPDETAHFYSNESTSSFIVTREGNQVYAWIIDRNIKPNQQTGSVTDQIRDSAVGTGARGIFSKMQWQGLADGIVKNSE